MLFPTVYFLIFFLVVHQVFWSIPDKWRKHWLFVTSAFFYGWWSPVFLVHFLSVIVISYVFILRLHRNPSRRVLWGAVGLNLLNLFFFKYINSLLVYGYEWFGLEGALALKEDLGILLPLAISFYTFQIIAFIVDVYRGEIREVSLLRFSVFILFFPQLIAGPIMRHREFLYQMDSPVRDDDLGKDGVMLVLSGIIKKVLIADQVAGIINPVWSNPSQYSAETLWVSVIGFSVQVYGDFSGYTDMARGTAALLGYRIPDNFSSPYFAVSFSDLWKRWHITLSTWLRDYLYIPLGGNRVSEWRYYMNVLAVMSLGGLWHGDTYNYFIWGFLHGVFLVTERMFTPYFRKKASEWRERSGEGVNYRGIAASFAGWVTVSLGWYAGILFFRGGDLGTSAVMLYGMTVGALEKGFQSGQTVKGAETMLNYVAVVYFLQYLHMRESVFVRKLTVWYHRYRTHFMFILLLLVVHSLLRTEHRTEQFIYFQF